MAGRPLLSFQVSVFPAPRSWASPEQRRRRKSSRSGPTANSVASTPAVLSSRRAKLARCPSGRCGLEGLRTLPPRENGGNFDVKQLTKGAKLLLPVFTKGALFSTGDGHFAQGDGEVCVTAVEMGATVAVRFKIHKGLANKRTFAGPVFSHPGYFADPKYAAPENFLGVMGMPINAKGDIESENLTLAARNALLNMITLLQERGYTREQAYIICSVAVDLRISNVVDVPNFVVSALLPLAIFNG